MKRHRLQPQMAKWIAFLEHSEWISNITSPFKLGTFPEKSSITPPHHHLTPSAELPNHPEKSWNFCYGVSHMTKGRYQLEISGLRPTFCRETEELSSATMWKNKSRLVKPCWNPHLELLHIEIDHHILKIQRDVFSTELTCGVALKIQDSIQKGVIQNILGATLNEP